LIYDGLDETKCQLLAPVGIPEKHKTSEFKILVIKHS